ncbi:hypothetical protein Patl1_01137 [Pistacia atlantica]|uniref:Uncharacterized protein n=1 Tax=Pistacia atlantica TaxID=434234 RepID=A0ACC1C9H3_9ROSI|nr:hypothetical protein Patl1_01137 [Pistacia atlantica]
MHGIVDEKTDVFAFGVLLLELVTGRRALDYSQQSVVLWARPLLRKNEVKELVDPSMGDEYDFRQMNLVLLAAYICIQQSSIRRPQMSQVVQLLNGNLSCLKFMKKCRSPLCKFPTLLVIRRLSPISLIVSLNFSVEERLLLSLSFTMPPEFKLNSSPPSRGRREIEGSPTFLKKSSKEESIDTVTDQRPCFYKIICDDEPERMKKFPRQFLKHISKELSDTATLRVVSGGLWRVKVKTIGNDVFMEDGWPIFVRDNSLRIKDFLLFHYEGKMLFSVTIFYPNGVERIGTSSIRMPQESAGISTGKRPRGRPRKNPVDTLNRQYTPLNSPDESSATDQGLASHKSKKLKTARKGENVNDKSPRLKTTQKGKNVNYNSKELQTTDKGKNAKAPFRDRIESSSKQQERSTMKPNLRMPQESAGISTGKRPRGRPRKNSVDTLNRQYAPSNSNDESSATDKGLASYKSKKLKTAHKGEKTTQKGRNVNFNSKELQTKEKVKNVKAPLGDRIESSSKQPKRTTMKPSLEKKPSNISKRRIAEGLLYLHEGCQRRIIHIDFKAANILLTEDFVPQTCDFGLAKWLPEQWTHHTVSKVEGTFGYLAPEFLMHGIVDEKTDVIAFGVLLLLLELVTGRRALDYSQQSIVLLLANWMMVVKDS